MEEGQDANFRRLLLNKCQQEFEKDTAKELAEKTEGMEQDDAEVAKWFRKAAEQGDSGVQYSLGLCYDEGQGVGQDP